jgi:hypothetical protein
VNSTKLSQPKPWARNQSKGLAKVRAKNKLGVAFSCPRVQ